MSEVERAEVPGGVKAGDGRGEICGVGGGLGGFVEIIKDEAVTVNDDRWLARLAGFEDEGGV